MRKRWHLALAGTVAVLFLLSVIMLGSFMAVAETAKKVEKKREEIKNGSFTVPYLPQKPVSTR